MTPGQLPLIEGSDYYVLWEPTAPNPPAGFGSMPLGEDLSFGHLLYRADLQVVVVIGDAPRIVPTLVAVGLVPALELPGRTVFIGAASRPPAPPAGGQEAAPAGPPPDLGARGVASSDSAPQGSLRACAAPGGCAPVLARPPAVP